MPVSPEGRLNRPSRPFTPEFEKALADVSPTGELRNLIFERMGSLYTLSGPVGLTILETLQTNDPNPTNIHAIKDAVAASYASFSQSHLYVILRKLECKGETRKGSDRLKPLITSRSGPGFHITPVGVAVLEGVHAMLEDTEVRIVRANMVDIYNEIGGFFNPVWGQARRTT